MPRRLASRRRVEGHGGVGGAVEDEHRHRASCRGRLVGEAFARDRGDGGDAVLHLARGDGGEEAAVGDARGVHARRVDAVRRRQVVQHAAREGEVVDVAGRAGSGEEPALRVAAAVRRHGDEAEARRSVTHAGVPLLALRFAGEPVVVEEDGGRLVGAIRRRDEDAEGALQAVRGDRAQRRAAGGRSCRSRRRGRQATLGVAAGAVASTRGVAGGLERVRGCECRRHKLTTSTRDEGNDEDGAHANRVRPRARFTGSSRRCSPVLINFP